MPATGRSIRTPSSRWIAAVALAAVMVAGLTACGDDGDESSSSTTAAAPSTDPTTTTTSGGTADATTSTTAPDDDTIRVEFAGGEVVGGVQRFPVEVGSPVRIEVTSDIAEEVHLHGYDVFVDVAPGTPAVLEVQADIPGVFEAELEGSHLPLLELEVS